MGNVWDIFGCHRGEEQLVSSVEGRAGLLLLTAYTALGGSYVRRVEIEKSSSDPN